MKLIKNEFGIYDKTDTNDFTLDQLHKFILQIPRLENRNEKESIEIERKWIVISDPMVRWATDLGDAFFNPDNHQIDHVNMLLLLAEAAVKENFTVIFIHRETYYLSVDPEIRIAKWYDKVDPRNKWYCLTYKSQDFLKRDEVDIRISEDLFFSLVKKFVNFEEIMMNSGKDIDKIPISCDAMSTKAYGTRLVYYTIDNLTDKDYRQCIEIEFPNKEEAENFEFNNEFRENLLRSGLRLQEVTNHSYYKMSQYWKRTRLDNQFESLTKKMKEEFGTDTEKTILDYIRKGNTK